MGLEAYLYRLLRSALVFAVRLLWRCHTLCCTCAVSLLYRLSAVSRCIAMLLYFCCIHCIFAVLGAVFCTRLCLLYRAVSQGLLYWRCIAIHHICCIAGAQLNLSLDAAFLTSGPDGHSYQNDIPDPRKVK